MATAAQSIAASFEELDPAALSQGLTDPASTTGGKPNGAASKADDVAAAKAGKPGDGAAAATGDEGASAETTKFADKEAIAVLEQLDGLGVTPANAEGIVSKAKALDTVVGWIENDQAAFLNHLRQNDPSSFSKLLEKATDLYLEINPATGSSAANGGTPTGSGGNQTSDVMNEIKAIRTRLDARDESDRKTATQQRLATVEKGYTDKVTTLLTTAGLSTRDFKAVKALINEEVSGSQQTLSEINRGTYVGLAKITQRVLAEWTTETKTAADEETSKREAVVKAGSRPVPGAAQNNGGDSRPRGTDAFDDAGDAFARALAKKK